MAVDSGIPRPFRVLCDSGLFTSNPTNGGLVPWRVTATMLDDARFQLVVPDLVFTEVHDYPDVENAHERMDAQFLHGAIAAGRVTVVATASYESLEARVAAAVAVAGPDAFASARQRELHGDENARFCRNDALIVHTAAELGLPLLTINKRLRTQVDPGPGSLRHRLWADRSSPDCRVVQMVVLDNHALTTKEHIYADLLALDAGLPTAYDRLRAELAAPRPCSADALTTASGGLECALDELLATDPIAAWLAARGLTQLARSEIGECIAAVFSRFSAEQADLFAALPVLVGPERSVALRNALFKRVREAVQARANAL